MAAKLYGLLGKDLSHSFSEKYFREKFACEDITDAAYRNFPIAAIADLPRLLAEHPDLRGFNVTIPYKESILPYLSEIHEDAASIGAVNCVVVERWSGGGNSCTDSDTGVSSDAGNGNAAGREKKGGVKLTGYNTDAPAFRVSLLGFLGTERPSALVLGSGGASKAVCHVLKDLGISYTIVSRTSHGGLRGYEDTTEAVIANNLLIINTTPLTVSAPGIPYESLTPRHFLFDLVYNPDPTEFLKKGRMHGAKTLNGMEMLIGQAERSWEIWRTCGTNSDNR